MESGLRFVILGAICCLVGKVNKYTTQNILCGSYCSYLFFLTAHLMCLGLGLLPAPAAATQAQPTKGKTAVGCGLQTGTLDIS